MEVIDISDTLPHRSFAPHRRVVHDITEGTVHKTGADNSTPQSTAAYHVGKGWGRIGYHFYIPKDGTVYQTLPLSVIGVHAPPNKGRVGVVLVGLTDDSAPAGTDAQLDSLSCLLSMLCSSLLIAPSAVLAHREAMPGHTDCPGAALVAWLARWRTEGA